MRHSLIAKLLGFLLLYPLSINSALCQNIDNQLLSNQLEAILNKQKYDLLTDLFLEKSFKQFEKNYQDFKKDYKEHISTLRDRVLLGIVLDCKESISFKQ